MKTLLELIMCGCYVSIAIFVFILLIEPLVYKVVKELKKSNSNYLKKLTNYNYKYDFKAHILIAFGVVFIMWCCMGCTYVSQLLAEAEVKEALTVSDNSTTSTTSTTRDTSITTEDDCVCGCDNEDITNIQPIDADTGMRMDELEVYQEMLINGNETWEEAVNEFKVPIWEERPVHYVTVSKYELKGNEYNRHELLDMQRYLYNGTREDFVKCIADRNIKVGLNLIEGDTSEVYQDNEYTFVCLHDAEGNAYLDFFYVEGTDYIWAYDFH